MFSISAYRCGELAQREVANDRPAADAIFGRLVRDLPDCEITLEQTGAGVLISMGPAMTTIARSGNRANTGEPT